MNRLFPKLSVIVPILSDTDSYISLLDSLRKQTRSREGEVETLLIFNPNPPPKDRVLPAEIKKLHCEKLGVNAARNLGISQAAGSWLYFLDDDCILPESNHLEKILHLLEDSPPHLILGGPYLDAKKKDPAVEAYQAQQNRWVRSGQSAYFGWQHFLGGNLIISREYAKKFKFDPSIQFGGAETELVYRMLRGGCSGRFVENIGVLHNSMVTVETLRKKAFLQGYTAERCSYQKTFLPPQYQCMIEAGLSPQASALLEQYQYFFSAGEKWFSKNRCLPSVLRLNFEMKLEQLRYRIHHWHLKREKLWRVLAWLRDAA